MGDFFRVDLDVLGRMTSSLQEAGDQMESALSRLGSVEGGQIGTDALNSSAHHFQSTWYYGLGQLQQTIKETDEGVKAAHDAYQQLDQAIKQAMDKVNSAVVTPMGADIDSLRPNLAGGAA
ncbi:hypothetical protein [Streptacidiphilus cavernicola]|uniref:WXG100 family type VII secretion target n=1 Tax=Streptacidiphilus cavernicola TaxID=3342716 RepID=A0ABV6W6H2_9ACTN